MLVQKETSYPCLPFFPFADWNVRCDGSTSNHADEANSYGNDGVWNKKTNPWGGGGRGGGGNHRKKLLHGPRLFGLLSGSVCMKELSI